MKVFLASGRFFFYWHKQRLHVALLARAWIEITIRHCANIAEAVALLARAWIEISGIARNYGRCCGRSPCESVD